MYKKVYECNIFQVISYVDPVKKEAEQQVELQENPQADQQAHLDQSRLVQGRYETSSLSKVMKTYFKPRGLDDLNEFRIFLDHLDEQFKKEQDKNSDCSSADVILNGRPFKRFSE